MLKSIHKENRENTGDYVRMKSILKYFLNVFGAMFIVIGLTCVLPHITEMFFCIIGTIMYMAERQISADDERVQEEKMKRLEEKLEELKNKEK